MREKLLKAAIITFSFALSIGLALYLDGRKMSFSSPFPPNWFADDPPPNQNKSSDRPDFAMANTPMTNPSIRSGFAPDSLIRGAHGELFECRSGKPYGVKDVEEGGVLKWTDSSGGVHYGDTAPAGAKVERINGWFEKDYFDLKVSYPTGRTSGLLKDEIAVAGRAIYQIYSDYLGEALISKSNIDVRVYTNEKDYRNYQQTVAPTIVASAPGFYSWRLNQAIVLQQPSHEQTRKTALHETTHVINAANFGRQPRWLNEGISSVMENITVNHQLKRLLPEASWQTRLGKQLKVLPLASLFNASESDWNGELRESLICQFMGFGLLLNATRKPYSYATFPAPQRGGQM